MAQKYDFFCKYPKRNKIYSYVCAHREVRVMMDEGLWMKDEGLFVLG